MFSIQEEAVAGRISWFGMATAFRMSAEWSFEEAEKSFQKSCQYIQYRGTFLSKYTFCQM